MNVMQIKEEPCTTDDLKKRCCCNCRHDIRIKQPNNPDIVSHCECEIDGHYISYVETFEGWCRHWAKQTHNQKKNKNKKGRIAYVKIIL